VARDRTRYPHAFSRSGGVPFVQEGSWREQPLSLREAVVSPTVRSVYERHWGLTLLCADCRHIVGYRNVGLPTTFKRWMNLTLLQVEAKCRCQCGSKNVRVHPWEG
jgi:hypothetical protein